MKIRSTALIAGIVMLVVWVSPSLSHHSFSAGYNITALVTLKGEITSVEWTNPHVYLTLAVRDSNNAIQEWRVEGGAINALKQNGWTQDMLRQMVKSHDTVIVNGYRARNTTGPQNADVGKRANLTGTVTKVEWIIPRSYFYLDVKDPSTNRVVKYSFATGDPGVLVQDGWSRNTLQPGMIVSVAGLMAQDGSNKGNASTVTLPDGRTLNGAAGLTVDTHVSNAWVKEIELPDGRKLAFN